SQFCGSLFASRRRSGVTLGAGASRFGGGPKNGASCARSVAERARNRQMRTSMATSETDLRGEAEQTRCENRRWESDGTVRRTRKKVGVVGQRIRRVQGIVQIDAGGNARAADAQHLCRTHVELADTFAVQPPR